MTNKSLTDSLIALLKQRSVQHGDFVLSSGRRSSYYIDARQSTMSAAGLELIGQLGLELVRKMGWRPSTVGGLTLGADPVAYAIALASRRSPPSIDAFTVRKEAKTHGTGRVIEGCFDKGARVVVVEDVITTGASALRALDAIRQAGGEVVGVLGVVDRDEGGLGEIQKAGVRVETLLSIRDLGLEPQ